MNDKIIKFPVNYSQRQINEHGQGYVPCNISSRWLQLSEESQSVGNKELFFIDVMTSDSSNNPRKICNLCISREDMILALNNVKLKQE